MSDSHPTFAGEQLSGPYVWRGEDYAAEADWIHHLSEEALADIDTAMRQVKEKGLSLDDVTAADFDLPSIAEDLKEFSNTVGFGRGFVLIKGVDIDKYTDEEMGIIFWGIGTHLGDCVPQSDRGDRLGNVRDEGGVGRYYTAGGPIEWHMDPVDVVGLLCLRPAKRGGESWLVSSFNLHNIIAAERPDLLEVLYDGYYYSQHKQTTDGAPSVTLNRIPVFDESGDYPVSFYLPLSVRMTEEMSEYRLSDKEKEAMAFIEEIAVRPGVAVKMDFQPGDMQFLNNRRILHARTDFEDFPEPERCRHLYRLWLMMPDWPALTAPVAARSAFGTASSGVTGAEATESATAPA